MKRVNNGAITPCRAAGGADGYKLSPSRCDQVSKRLRSARTPAQAVLSTAARQLLATSAIDAVLPASNSRAMPSASSEVAAMVTEDSPLMTPSAIFSGARAAQLHGTAPEGITEQVSDYPQIVDPTRRFVIATDDL